MKKVMLFGDSLTLGRIGIAYRRYLSFPTEARGIEGDTWTGVATRAKLYLSKRKPIEEIILVIQGGANDLLLSSRPQGERLINPKTPPRGDDEEFAEVFSEMLFAIEQEHPSISLIICSLPIIGENLESLLNEKRRQRNRLLEALVSHSASALWCDIATPLETIIIGEQGQQRENLYFLDDINNFALDAAYIGDSEEKAAEISRNRNLLVTIDGIHPNGRGARAIAKALDTALSDK